MLQRVFCGRRVAILLAALTGVAIFVPPSSVALAAGLAEKLVGTWRIVRFIDTDARGKVTYLFGENPRGYIAMTPPVISASKSCECRPDHLLQPAMTIRGLTPRCVRLTTAT